MSNLRLGYSDLRKRIKTTPDGKWLFVRFTLAQRTEHLVLIVSFTLLAVTGLIQKFSSFDLSIFAIGLLGGIETVRQIHHFLALVLIGQSVYHLAYLARMIVVRKHKGQMWPNWQDVRDAVQMVRFNAGRASSRPRFGRYSFDEKMEYWALIWGTLVMATTGLIQWFPTRITETLPGEAIPIAKAVHGWEAILAVLAILTWHVYHTVVKTLNKSIFTGLMTEEEMQHEHPLEYEAIMADLRAAVPPIPIAIPGPAPIIAEPEGNGQHAKRGQRQAKTEAKAAPRKRSPRSSKASLSDQPAAPDSTADLPGSDVEPAATPSALVGAAER
jgi:formate dehydrogenase gamma subunit